MTETVQFRIQLPAALRDMFKATCLRKNVTMTDHVVRLIEQDIAGISLTQTPASQEIRSINDDRLIARVVEASDQLGSAATSLSKSLRTALDEFGARLLRSIPKPQTQEQIDRARALAVQQDQQRCDLILAEVKAIGHQINQTVENGHLLISTKIEAKHTLLHALVAGVIGGLLLSAIFLWSISGTAPARSIAIGLTAADNDLQAARQIVGNGSLWHGAYMSETHSLLKNAEFRESYARCVGRAKASKTSIKCTVRFPLLLPAE